MQTRQDLDEIVFIVMPNTTFAMVVLPGRCRTTNLHAEAQVLNVSSEQNGSSDASSVIWSRHLNYMMYLRSSHINHMCVLWGFAYLFTCLFCSPRFTARLTA